MPPGEGGPGGASGEGGLGGTGAPPWSTEVETAQDAFGEDAVTLTGTLTCSEGSGPFHVYVMPPPPEDGALPDEGPPVALTSVKLDGPGAFSVKVPPGRDVVVLGFEDSDDDGAPAEGGIFFHGEGTSLGTDSGTALALDCLNLAGPPAGTPTPPAEAPTPGVLPEDLPPAPLEGGEGAPQPKVEGENPPPEGGEQPQ